MGSNTEVYSQEEVDRIGIVGIAMIYKKYLKRFLDVMLSGVAIVIISPLYLIIAMIVRIQMGSPILFSQDRIGINEKIFKLYKFRSMTNEVDANGSLLPDEKRLTKFGTALRSSSLDELPELLMIFKGDMSIVGPRPQPKECGPFYTDEERVVHTVRGGLLPPDSLSLEVQCDWDTQLKYEAEYAKNVSLWLDIKVILCTFVILYKRLKNNYGADNRPELYEERAQMPIPERTRLEWEAKGVKIK